MKPTPKKKAGKNQPEQFIKYSGLAIQLMITLAVFIGGGYLLDRYLEFRFPVFTLVLSFVALFGIFYKLFQELKKNS